MDAQLVSFIDLGPTVLNLAGVPVPKHIQGRALLGTNLTPPRQYVYGARDRMDERYDSVRMVRDRRYRYLRNYEPHKPYAQHTAYMEEGFIMKELRRLKAEGDLPPGAGLYMAGQKPVEELYDVEKDPHEINNLAISPEHQTVLKRLRAAHERWALETRDLGLIPEPEVAEREKRFGTRYAILRQPGSQQYLQRLRALVEAVNRDMNPALVRRAWEDPDPAFRYWAVIGLTKTEESTRAVSGPIRKALGDLAPVVRIAAARAAAAYLDDEKAVALLARELQNENEWARLHAAIALDELGARARPARQALEQALALKDSGYTARVAEHALRQLAAK